MKEYSFSDLQKDIEKGNPIKQRKIAFISQINQTMISTKFCIHRGEPLGNFYGLAGNYEYSNTTFPGHTNLSFVAPNEYVAHVIRSAEMISGSELKHFPGKNFLCSYKPNDDMPELESLVQNIHQQDIGPAFELDITVNNGDTVNESRISTYVFSKGQDKLGLLISAYRGDFHLSHLAKTKERFPQYDIKTAGGSYCCIITNHLDDEVYVKHPCAVVVTGIPSDNIGQIDKRLMPVVIDEIVKNTEEIAQMPVVVVNGHPNQ
jgi:hypothetical protein